MQRQKTNLLIGEKSPYLLQHAYNPVQWYPWGEAAFAKAQNENKPVFLSIGYSTCHWCHVMAHESFEDEKVAQLINEHFVAIKVDREERPELDSIYMSFVTATTGSGGWPLSVFLTPQQQPFYGGTYFPPEPRWGSPGFKDILWSVHNKWIKEQDKIRQSGEMIVDHFLQRFSEQEVTAKVLEPEILAQAYEQLANNFDIQNGGFGHSPKFPMGHTLSFLLRYWTNNNQPHALIMVEQTLAAMSHGGMCDQLGGGFHRYATDAQWQVPHFEKMLYDQALLAKIYLEAFIATGKELYADTAKHILDYVLREMCDQQGGFYSAVDADSLESADDHQKKEGAFYVWSVTELKSLLTSEELQILSYHFGIEPNGNAQLDPHGEFIGKNILYVKHSLAETAAHVQAPAEEVERIIQGGKEKLFAARAKRPLPHLDDKVLVDWNGLMISSLAMAGRILDQPRYLQAAEKAARFILVHLKRDDGRLLHRYRDGEAGILAGLDDYVFFITGLLDLFEYSFDPQYFKQAVRLNQEMMDLFWDENSGGLFLTPKDGEQLIFRPKEVYDGAVPSGNSLAAHHFLRLYHLTFEQGYLVKSEQLFKNFYAQMLTAPSAYTQMMMSLQFYFGPVKEIGVVGDVEQIKGREMLALVFRSWIAQRVVTVKTLNFQKEMDELFSMTKGQDVQKHQVLVYVCENQMCHLPAENPQQLRLLFQRG
ncbi:MAG: thioredoxin domain-containing protein [Candidatus Omnitrophica bacterium]|nr:thioredoxin domain-containing protein [Candidatus Omnitrophota bacterium]